MAKITGGCMCGAIRYKAESEPLAHAVCFCTDCQKANGGAPTYAVIVSRDTFRITAGAPRAFSTRGDKSGESGRFYCADCGTPLFSKSLSYPDIMSIKVGSLDDPSIFKPNFQIFTESAQRWMHVDEKVTAFARAPQ